MQGGFKHPSANSKKKRTVSQDLIHSGSHDAFTGLKRVKSGSPCLSFNPHAAIPSTSNRSTSPCTTLNALKDDAPAGLSTATINNLRSFIYRPVETRTSTSTNETSAETTAREGELSAPCSDASEARPEVRIGPCQDLLDLDLHARSLESVSNQLLRAYSSHQPDLGEEANGSNSGVDFSAVITSDLQPEVWNALPDFELNGTTPAVEPASNFSNSAVAQGVQCREETDEALSRYQPEDLGHEQSVGDFETDYDDHAWNTPSNKAPHSTKYHVSTNAPTVSTSDTSKLHQEVNEFDVDSCDDEFLVLYEALQDPVDDDTGIDTSAFPPQSPDSDRRTEEWISDTQIGDEDWNALYDIHTSASTIGLPEPVGVFEDLEVMDVVGRDSEYLLPPIDDLADSDFAPETEPAKFSEPAKFFESEENNFDEQVNEEHLLQIEAQVLQSEEFDITDDEFDVDESVLLQAERDMLASAAVMRERNRTNGRRALPPPNSNRRRNEIPSPKSLERRPAAYQLWQESVHDEPIEPTPPSPVSIITISSTSSPIRKTPTSSLHSTHEIPPFVRSPFPKAVTTRCPIYGVSNRSMLRVCFRIAEVFKAASSQRSSDTTTNVEFYAAVTHSTRCADIQTFNFADLFFPTRPPFLTGSCQGWRGSQLYEHDTGSFLDASPTRLRMCRAVGTLTRTVAGQLDVKILNIWEASWEDVSWVRGIVDP